MERDEMLNHAWGCLKSPNWCLEKDESLRISSLYELAWLVLLFSDVPQNTLGTMNAIADQASLVSGEGR